MRAIRFKCERCDNIDIDTSIEGKCRICTRCRTGEWHGHFEETKYMPGITKGLINVSDSDDLFEDEGPSFG